MQVVLGEAHDPIAGRGECEVDRRVLPSGPLALVRRAVDALGPRHKPVVLMRMIQDLSTRETAHALGIPEGTVLSRLSRAMQELSKALSPYMRSGALKEEQ